MVTTFLNAIFTAGLPLFLLALILVSWALNRNWLKGSTVKDLQGSMKAFGKAQKDKSQRQNVDPAFRKWLSFGGGFYGMVALYTWLLIEWQDVATFLSGLGDLVFDFQIGTLIGLVIEFFIQSMMNFVVAIAWPAYWLSDSRQAWVLLFVAYGGYWLGIKAANYSHQRGWSNDIVTRISTIFNTRL